LRTLKAIETKYRGIYFRSMLEARWAMFFDLIGLRYVYECVGMDVYGEWYLPDFYLPDSNAHVEIKPDCIGVEEQLRVDRLMKAWRGMKDYLLLIKGHPGQYAVSDCNGFDDMQFARCRRCDGLCLVSVSQMREVGKHTCGDHDRMPLESCQRLQDAAEMAMRHDFTGRRQQQQQPERVSA